jgi:hypothetical protein
MTALGEFPGLGGLASNTASKAHPASVVGTGLTNPLQESGEQTTNGTPVVPRAASTPNPPVEV